MKLKSEGINKNKHLITAWNIVNESHLFAFQFAHGDLHDFQCVPVALRELH